MVMKIALPAKSGQPGLESCATKPDIRKGLEDPHSGLWPGAQQWVGGEGVKCWVVENRDSACAGVGVGF